MYNIYFEKRVLKISSSYNPETDNPNSIIYNAADSFFYDNLPSLFETSGNLESLILLGDEESSIETIFRQVCSSFTEINAGGGIIRNEKGEYLMIFRNGVWDLPKGKQEEGEPIAETAIREVMEECGMEKLIEDELLCITHHCYKMHGKFMLKHTYWFNMRCGSAKIPVPQIEENITKAEWISREKVASCLENSYPSIREVFIKAGVIE